MHLDIVRIAVNINAYFMISLPSPNHLAFLSISGGLFAACCYPVHDPSYLTQIIEYSQNAVDLTPKRDPKAPELMFVEVTGEDRNLQALLDIWSDLLKACLIISLLRPP